MDFGVLGPVQVRVGDQLLGAGSGRERFVLAMLLLSANRVTDPDVLVDALWVRPPRSARAQLYNLISNWRQRLGPHHVGPEELIETRPGGYVFRLGPHQLDLDAFRKAVAEGRAEAEKGRHDVALVTLKNALDLWRGRALADVPDELLADRRRLLEDERLAATELRIESELAVGRFHDALRELPALIDEHPYREQLYAAHMRALAGIGSRGDALATYQRLHRTLTDDLGVVPGPQLQALQQLILRGEDPLVPQAIPTPVVPRQLPPVTARLTGRDKTFGEICATLQRTDGTPPAVLLTGPGGIGKSALAVAAGHELTSTFPDGQLHADLRGAQPTPTDPHAVLGRFLRALGVDGRAVPDDRDERIARYRTELADRRMLVVLDDAASEEQIRPLVPGTPRAGVVITSRHQLRALVGIERWTVQVLASADAVELLANVVGGERIASDPSAAAEIVRLCGQLPLAVSIAAARLAGRPDWTLAELARRLDEHRERLDELTAGDLDVRGSIALSYQQLDGPQRELFRRLGLVTAPSWPGWVASELCGGQADQLVDQLLQAHLVEPLGCDAVGQHRFRMHDLVADFARERAHVEEESAVRAEAQTRVLSGWLARSTEADASVNQKLTSSRSGTAWFEAERASLVAAVHLASEVGAGTLAADLALRCASFLALRSYNADWEDTLRTATEAVRDQGLDHLLLELLDASCVVNRQLARNENVIALATEQLGLAHELNDSDAELAALGNAGWAARHLGQIDQATAWLEQAVDACTPQMPNRMASRAFTGLAMLYRDVERIAEALPLTERALELERLEGNPRIVTICLQNYGWTLYELGRLEEAEQAAAEAMSLATEINDEQSSARNESLLADLQVMRGNYAVARELLERSASTAQRLGDKLLEAEQLISLAHLAAAQDRPRDAVGPLLASLDIWRELDLPMQEARIHARLDLTYAAAGRTALGERHGRAWRSILAEHGLDVRCLRLAVGRAWPGSERITAGG
nr:BTAD domain-containing putative transcriptional regulator [Tenggerimyces flavus]